MKETIEIQGMTCGGCVASVQRALARLPIVHAGVEIGSAVVEYDDARLNHAQIIEAIQDAGFDVVS